MSDKEKWNTSLYLTGDDNRIVMELMSRHGLTRSGVYRLAIQRLHKDPEARRERLLEIAEEIARLA